ncbi:pilus assembly protein N-terminal domain-containing protein [Bradyrhizobium sp. USDA 241]|uniref:pilus assembly protein N-terminal domain-containing protein n=1 Tax=Bradyrhizobium sp. USDA 241 TaxID=3377725 RepID=UPI003C73542F
MKRLVFAALFACLATSGAFAQPEEIGPEEVVSLVVGNEKVLSFPKDITDVIVVNDGIVRARAHTQRTISLTAIGPGATNIMFLGSGGQRVYHAQIVVGPAMYPDKEPGHVVRIYGWTPSGKQQGNGGGQTININNGGNLNAGGGSDQPDFVARYCSPTGCSAPMPQTKSEGKEESSGTPVR